MRPLVELIGEDVIGLPSSDNPTAVDAVAAAAAEAAEAVTSTTGVESEALPEAARVIVEEEQEAAAAKLWMRARPRVRFYTHQVDFPCMVGSEETDFGRTSGVVGLWFTVGCIVE